MGSWQSELFRNAAAGQAYLSDWVPIMNKQQTAITLLRVALGFVFGWFAINSLIDPAWGLSWIPPWMVSLSPIPLSIIVFIVSILEIVVSVSFILGLYTKYAAWLGMALLLGIIVAVGGPTNDVGVRDIGLFFAVAVFTVVERTMWSVDAIRTR